MTEEFLKKLVSPLKRVEPTSEFMARSKARIMLTKQEAPKFKLRLNFFESLTFTGAIGLASILLLAGIGSLSYIASDSSNLADNSLNNAVLISEAESANFQLQIKEITYFDESAKQVALVLEKIAEPNEE